MPITNVDQVERFTRMCGASIPERVRRELQLRRDDPKAALEFGVALATLQCADLLRRGALAQCFLRGVAGQQLRDDEDRH